MDSARKLPCGHLFHNSCLRSWLEQTPVVQLVGHHSRIAMKMKTTIQNALELPVRTDGTTLEGSPMVAELTNFFHFDGSRYASWLPSVSVEVTRPHLINIGVGHLTVEPNDGLTVSPRNTVQSFSTDLWDDKWIEFFLAHSSQCYSRRLTNHSFSGTDDRKHIRRKSRNPCPKHWEHIRVFVCIETI